ncbi:DNA cytosine methyltransferase [Streptomyces flavotricini]|uniref:Cytosine-specific methyltransferase n=1 Tax=Streptomyces flavotricini TaxID=66888 RepID=A0ABS8EA28_9ACTN|nr:DNA cytosine methyltransferase [Streptomyces flavotricini]MCC0098007.1 DNA cytosine methyltransferase [Streptomyces flavotricini]
MSTPQTSASVTVVDLFAGCGGFTQGFHAFRPEGGSSPVFRTVAAVEHDIAAASTYALNFGDEAGGTEHIHAGDIEDWTPERQALNADVILGGPPCQGFSGLGKEDRHDPRNKLWREYARVVNAIKPKIFIVENVDRFLRSPEFALLHEATEKPDGMLKDYVLVQHSVLNAADYGVPQARRRVMVVAVRRDLTHLHDLAYPDRTHSKDADKFLPGAGGPKKWLSVEDEVFRHTSEETSTTELPDRKCEPLGTLLPGVFRTTDLHFGRNPTDLSRQRYRAIPEGGNRHDLPPHLSTEKWLAHRNGSHDVMGRMYRDRPSVTIRTEFYKPEKGRYLHPWAHRPITHYEAALIQGFPADFEWSGSKIQIGRQIGNAVPVGLAKALAGMVYGALTR